MTPWVIMVSRNLVGREYVSVIDASMVARKQSLETLPTWRLVEVPLTFRDLAPGDILAACVDGRIAI
jgi:hypothetical protein